MRGPDVQPESFANVLLSLKLDNTVPPKADDTMAFDSAETAFARVSKARLRKVLDESELKFQLVNGTRLPTSDGRVLLVHHSLTGCLLDEELENGLDAAMGYFCESVIQHSRMGTKRIELLDALTASIRKVMHNAYTFYWKQRLFVERPS